MTNIKDRINDYFEYPRNANLLEFCNNYKDLSEILFSCADEKQLKIIEEALESILKKSVLNETPENFKGLTNNQIIEIFKNYKIDVLNQVPDSKVKIIKDRINKILIKNLTYAKDLEMSVPVNNTLSNREYFDNYEIAKEQSIFLGILLENRKKK